MHKVGTRRYILLQVSRYIFMSVLSNHRSCTYLRYFFYSATAALTLDTRIPSEAAPPAPQPHHPQSHTQLRYLHQTRICQPPFSTCQLHPFACHKNYNIHLLSTYLPYPTHTSDNNDNNTMALYDNPAVVLALRLIQAAFAIIVLGTSAFGMHACMMRPINHIANSATLVRDSRTLVE